MNSSLSLHQSRVPSPHSTMNSTNAFSSNPSKKIKLTIIPPRQLFVNISSDEDITTTPSPITTSSSPTHPNAPSKTTSTNQTSSSQENTSSSFHSKHITLSLSPITPLDHIHDTPSPPSQPQPQPPIMGHPLFYNYHDYHRSTCICYSYNRNLFFTLRDEMNIMFAHLEYLLTTAITSHFPPPS
ncbi:hypothetical protein Tco_1496094 [Tanacetum coccineum]